MQQFIFKTHHTYDRSGKSPADLPTHPGVVTDHFLDSVIKPIHSESPGHCDALEEY